MRQIFVIFLVLLASTCALGQAYPRQGLIPAQSIVPLQSFAAPEGQGLITLQVHEKTIAYSAQRLPIMAQSIVGGLETYGVITTFRPFNIPLIWYLIGAAVLVAVLVSTPTLKKYYAIEEIPFVNLVNQLYIYIIVFFIIIILWMGTNSNFAFSFYYLGANLAALVLLDWLGKKFEWYDEWKMGLAVDNTIFGYAIPSGMRLMGIFVGTSLIAYYLSIGSAYIAAPTYSAGGGTFQDIMSRIIPAIPEDLLWLKITPLLLVIAGMKVMFAFANDKPLSITETRLQKPRLFFATLGVGIVLATAFTGLVIWPSYHESAYSQTAALLVATPPTVDNPNPYYGRPVDEVKKELLSSVSNFGFIGSFVTMTTGSTLSADATHMFNNIRAD